MFAQVLGPYLVVAALTMVARVAYMRALLTEFDTDAAWPWICGAFVLPMGLSVIVLHPYWRGAAASIVSLLGWLTAFKGLALMVFPVSYLSFGNKMLDAVIWWQVSGAVLAMAGLYLTVIGWVPAASRTASERPTSASN
ncbi:hypothetical protein [Mycobacteroides franklinii]|uniref:Uncharacterized protein n=1 Tax=Mycobacteroides franklinii TaxID=948102 RepID=A0A4R5P8C2_9MYCO|nr:hypothetical protein [Mycobacteroides franklinii]ORA63643.1 hypothetical protein BST24_03900 [Mycobacteroides franklinii]TDH19679.1 hypothetical protein EJ571_23100 [Mycobacteroides franklinii]